MTGGEKKGKKEKKIIQGKTEAPYINDTLSTPSTESREREGERERDRARPYEVGEAEGLAFGTCAADAGNTGIEVVDVLLHPALRESLVQRRR